ncbi:N-acetylglucosamine-6-phosphate deacetylase [Mucilaginibacter sp. KACC 22773]|uniref:N-acetylglucosamine-6-phosphate deacetylase n=1 Tax=Mucilaginibacter sp. KACC 22773 TaxID=3025671 RepID=UPI0023653500|nr:N-acetylglucosamine-6-phosphate deacetylase [Mucilaginibacter sp. KACC 22773]WDF81207.1 N-acetylglucosamine-6-phosphate deacetylase [Mucilaginibacter sp. KACC 22773]
MNKQVKITNGRIITPKGIINGTILINQTKIAAISERDIDAPDALVIDAHGNYVSPGFIDIHVHGGGGHDFMDGNEEAFLEIARTHARYGTTAMVPTTLTAEKADLLKTLDLYATADAKNTMGAQFLGMHLEGPYFAMNQRGAQDPRYIRNPDEEEYKEIIAYSKAIKRWSAAPELPGAIQFAKYLQANGIMPALAHTDAIYEEVALAFENGYKLATHLYSGMSGVTRRNAYRYAGVIEAAFLIDAMDVEVIADGIHLPAPLLKLVYKIKGPDRIALITDAMRAAGMPEGDSVLGNKDTGLKVIVEDGVAKLPDRSSFAGSVATCDRLVRTMMTMADVPLPEAVKMMTKNPAMIMGVDDRKGALVEGLDADIAIFDEQVNIQATIVNGKLVYGG